MFSVIQFFRPGNPVQVFLRGERLRQGVVSGVDAVGLLMVRVREYTPSGWQLEVRPRVELLPWPAISRVEPLTRDDIDEHLMSVFIACGYCPDGAQSSLQGTEFERDTLPRVDSDDISESFAKTLMVFRARAVTRRWNARYPNEQVAMEHAEEAAEAWVRSAGGDDEWQERMLDFTTQLPLALVEAIFEGADLPQREG